MIFARSCTLPATSSSMLSSIDSMKRGALWVIEVIATPRKNVVFRQRRHWGAYPASRKKPESLQPNAGDASTSYRR